MPKSRLRPVLLVVLTAAVAAPSLHAQSRDRWYEEDRRERERDRRRREERRREEEARERAERARREARLRAEAARLRAERERRARHEYERYRYGNRPRLVLGGGADLRQFGGDERWFVQGGVDFRGRSGFGVRPEVLFGWSERQQQSVGLAAPCPNCLSIVPQTQLVTGRSRMLGVAVSGTYTAALGRSPVRPYVMSGLGVFSTRVPEAVVPVGFGPALPPAPLQTARRFRTATDLGLTAGAGLEADIGPVRLFGELRYLLVDQPRPLGFSGALPLTIGLKL